MSRAVRRRAAAVGRRRAAKRAGRGAGTGTETPPERARAGARLIEFTMQFGRFLPPEMAEQVAYRSLRKAGAVVHGIWAIRAAKPESSVLHAGQVLEEYTFVAEVVLPSMPRPEEETTVTN